VLFSGVYFLYLVLVSLNLVFFSGLYNR